MDYFKIRTIILFNLLAFNLIAQNELPINQIHGEKRRLIDEKEQVEIKLEHKEQELQSIKGRYEHEIQIKNRIIENYKQKLNKELEKSNRYAKEVSKFKDSLNFANEHILFLNSEIEKLRNENEDLKKIISGQQSIIVKISAEKQSLASELASLQKQLGEIDFFTSIRIHDVKVISYSSNRITFSFVLIGVNHINIPSPQEVQLLISIQKKTRMRGEPIYLKGRDESGKFTRDVSVFCMTDQRSTFTYQSSELIEDVSEETGEYCNYLIDFKIAYKNYIIWKEPFPIYDLSKIKKE